MTSALVEKISGKYLFPENKKVFFTHERLSLLEKVERSMKEEEEKAPCSKPAYIGMFFDGTNNSYRHAIENNTQQESNVARLYDTFPGQCVPGILPPETDWKESLDLYKRHFKIYVPGVGKAFPNIGDQTHWFKSLFDPSTGAGMASYGQARILWAMAQVINFVYRYYWGGMGSSILITDSEIIMVTENVRLTNRGLKTDIKDELADRVASKLWETKILSPSLNLGANVNYEEYWAGHDYKVAIVFREWLLRLKSAIGNKHKNLDNQPLNKIHIYSFGFSRGAAEARVFFNWFVRLCKVDALLNNENGGELSLAGIPVVHEFMGLFDTVASIGIADMFASSTGHDWWGDADSLHVPPEVGKCVHFVSAHEQRRCFPLDSVYQGQKLPEYCEEIVFPGVHSDIGGGYAPLDQGKGFQRDGTSSLSRIPLIEMYRRARLAGVPLILEKSSTKAINAYKINKRLIDDFNNYLSFFDRKEGTTAELVTPHWIKQAKFRINLLNSIYPCLESKKRAKDIDSDLRLDINKKEKILNSKEDKKEISKFNLSDDKVYVDRLKMANKAQDKSMQMLQDEYSFFHLYLKNKDELCLQRDGALVANKECRIGNYQIEYKKAPESYEIKYLVDNVEGVGVEKEVASFIDNYVHDSIAGFCLDGVDEHTLSGTLVYFRYRCIFSGSDVMYQVPYGNGFSYSREEEKKLKERKKHAIKEREKRDVIEKERKERERKIMADQISLRFSWVGMMTIR